MNLASQTLFRHRSGESLEMDKSTRSKCSSIPQRVILGVMTFLGVVVAFLMRQSLPVAITEMVVPIVENINETDINSKKSFICPVDGLSVESTIVTKINATRYNWTQEQQGWILSAFFVGYIITHLPGAILAERFGGKWTFSISILISTIANAAIPMAVEYGGWKALIAMRILMGLGNGCLFPALSVLLACWVPQKERGKLATLVFGGGSIGTLITFYISGVFLSLWPWPIVFYFWSGISIIWFILFTFLCYNDPASHPFISKGEVNYLERELGQLKRHDNLPSTPWKSILTSRPIIVLIISQVFNDFVYFVLASDLPKYMKEVLGFTVREVGLYSSLPYLLMWIVSVISGFFCDYLISRNYLTVTQARKIFGGLGSVLPAICIVAASYAGCSKLFVIIWFMLAMTFMGNYFPGLRLNVLDLSPNYAGSIMACSNGMGSIAGVVAPTLVGILTPDSTLEQWRLVFWITFVVSMFRTVIFSLWGSGKVQPWDNPNQYKSPESHKLTENIKNDKA